MWLLNRPIALAILVAVFAVPYIVLFLMLQPPEQSFRTSLILAVITSAVIGVGVYISVVKYGQGD